MFRLNHRFAHYGELVVRTSPVLTPSHPTDPAVSGAWIVTMHDQNVLQVNDLLL